MGQAYDNYLHRFARRRTVGLRELGREGILVVYVQLHKGDHADHRYAAPFLQHDNAGIQNGLVPAEFIDDKALEQGLFVRLQQHMGSQQLGKDAAAVNVARKQYRRADRFGKSHIYNIVFLQIDLRRTPRALDHDNVVLSSERVVGLQNHGHQALFIGKIFPGIHIAQDLSVDDHLGARICRGLEQNGVHPHIRRNACRLRLHDLGAAHLQTVLRDKRVQGHILGFKGSDPISVLAEDPAQAGGQKALAGVGHGSLDHDCFCHKVCSPKSVSRTFPARQFSRIIPASCFFPGTTVSAWRAVLSGIRRRSSPVRR